jgi:ribulose-phosphate 3-epimerase
MPEALDRVQRLHRLLPETLIEVDGGVGEGNARDLYQAGARLLVAGTAILAAPDIGAAYRQLQSAALNAAGTAAV